MEQLMVVVEVVIVIVVLVVDVSVLIVVVVVVVWLSVTACVTLCNPDCCLVFCDHFSGMNVCVRSENWVPCRVMHLRRIMVLASNR